jgi:mannose-1-phosphate guanylyltransferase
MAGGSGTRFWPRSRRRLPKQLLPVLGRQSLLQATVARLRGLIPPSRVLVVTHREHASAVRRQLPMLPRANLLTEPVGRNTAPCLALAALEIARRDPDALFVSLPADHAIGDSRAFRAVLGEAFAWAPRATAVTIGLRPTAPETGYGYLRLGARVGGRARRVQAFIEKPSATRARRFLASGRYLWNAGIFVWEVATVLALLERHLPRVIRPLRAAIRAAPSRRATALARAYARLPAVSIDYGIMEKARDVLVVPGRFGWSDVGNWAALATLARGRPGRAPVVPVDASGYVVFGSDRLIALVGVRDLIVVDTADALLICDRRHAQDVRRVVRELERRHLEAYL